MGCKVKMEGIFDNHLCLILNLFDWIQPTYILKCMIIIISATSSKWWCDHDDIIRNKRISYL